MIPIQHWPQCWDPFGMVSFEDGIYSHATEINANCASHSRWWVGWWVAWFVRLENPRQVFKVHYSVYKSETKSISTYHTKEVNMQMYMTMVIRYAWHIFESRSCVDLTSHIFFYVSLC